MAPSRPDDRSGLLDIHALSSVIDAQRRGGASASSVAMPTFGTPWALRDVSAAPVPARPTAATARVVVGPDHRPLYVMIAALSLAVASLGAYVLMRPAPTVVVERTAAAAAPEAEPATASDDEHEGEATPAVTEPEPEAAPPPAVEAKPEPDPARSRTIRGTRPSPSPKPTPAPKAVTKDAGVLPVECIIDPKSCDKGKPQPPRPKDAADDRDASSPQSLPAAPSSSQIRDAMAAVKPQAKACGSRHGGSTGEKVRVKLSVSGATGKITAAQAEGEHAGTPLGRCVADALAKATLPKFSKPQAGVMYAVTL